MNARPVLVVDDDADMRHLTETVLAYAGIPTVCAVNGQEALETARAVRPSVILLDLMMPVMDGYEFRARQLQDPTLRRIPVICVTAVPPHESDTRTLQVDACVHKPIDWEELLREVLKYAA
ncbi:MAG TPA: response regulator [Vicinamibacterales bacterium]|jgi:CheY-like chemotaxis protein